MKNRNLLLLGALLLLPFSAAAQNPISPMGVYIADPTSRVWQKDGRLFIYGSTDTIPQGYCSKTYHVLTSDNLKDWMLHPNSFRNAEVLFAPDVMKKDDTFYLYYDIPNGDEFVATSDSPYGPFRDGVKIEGPKQIDPNIFIDDDGQAYYFWGQFSAKGAKMNPDLKTLDWSTMQDSLVTEAEHGFHEGSYVIKRGKYYYYTYADISRRGRPTCLGYAMSTSPMGPYEYKGIIIDNYRCDPETWNNHGSIVEYKGRWYVLYHRSTHASRSMRKACIEPIRFNADGTIDEVEMTSQGAAGPLDAFAETDAARACWMMGHVRIQRRADQPEREELGGIRSGDIAAWKYLDFGKKGANRFQVRMKSEQAGTLLVRIGGPDGQIVGKLSIPAHTGWSTYETECRKVTGVQSVWLEFHGGAADKDLCSVDKFRFLR